MAAVTYTTRCSDGASVTFEGTITFPAGSPVIDMDSECYLITGYGDESSATPQGFTTEANYANCDTCAVTLNNGFYVLTDCTDPSVKLYTISPGIQSYVGQYLKINGTCYSVAPLGVNAWKKEMELTEIDLSSPDTYQSCSDCLTTYVKASRCDNNSVIYLAEAAYPSGTTGLIWKLSDGNCYQIDRIQTAESLQTQALTLTQSYGGSNQACADCLTQNYFRLENCDDSDDVIFIPDSDGTLVQATHADKVIRININGTDQCFKTTFVNLPLSTPNQTFPGALLSVHETCADCQTQGIIEIPPDLTGETLVTLEESGEDCDILKITNLTQLYNETLWSEFAAPVLEITTPDGFKLVFDSSTIPVTDTSLNQPFDPLTPTEAMLISIADIEENLDAGVLQTTGDDPQELSELPWVKFPDGIYEVFWRFQTIGDTSGLYEKTAKKLWLCTAKKCYSILADRYLNKSCINCDQKDDANIVTLMELNTLIAAAKMNFDLDRFECTNEVLKAISKICSDEDCGCQQ